MSRPKGSKNKIKNNVNSKVIVTKLEKQVENAPRCNNSMRGWINWGVKNDFPLQLSNLYYNSPTHQSCVDFAVAAIIGDGIDYDKIPITQEEVVPNYQETWDDFIEKIALDYIIYGAFAFQIIKNKDNKTYSFYHQSVSDVRCGEKDEDGVIQNYYISSDWTSLGKYPPIEMRAFGFQDDEELAQGVPYLFMSQSYSPDMLYYQMPRYMSACKAIQADIELQRYDLRSVTNNFSASGILTLNRIDDDEERKMILDNIEAMFQGSDNANSLMINFKNNDEEKPVEFTKFDKDVNNINLFESNNDRGIARILSAHRIPSKQLIGYDADTSMLGGEGNLLNVAFNLYNKTVASKNRSKIVGTINKMFKLNGIDVKIELKPLSFSVLQPTSIVDETKDEAINDVKDTYDGDNVEEKITNNNEIKQ